MKGSVPHEDASVYVARGNQIDIAVDISEYISRYGSGVYTIRISGKSGDEFMALSNYSVFIETP